MALLPFRAGTSILQHEGPLGLLRSRGWLVLVGVVVSGSGDVESNSGISSSGGSSRWSILHFGFAGHPCSWQAVRHFLHKLAVLSELEPGDGDTRNYLPMISLCLRKSGKTPLAPY